MSSLLKVKLFQIGTEEGILENGCNVLLNNFFGLYKKRYNVDELADKIGHEVLHFSPYQYVYNPI